MRDDPGDDLVALAKFDGLTGAQPSLQALGIAKLADVYAKHNSIVAHNVTHVNTTKAIHSIQ